MKVGIDFDGVLFKTNLFKQFLDKKIPGFIDSYVKTGGLYDPQEHVRRLGISREDLYKNLGAANKFLRDDIEELKRLDQYKLILISRGPPEFQRKKIKYSGVTSYIDDMKIVTNESKSHCNIDLLIDDNPHELEQADVEGYLFNSAEESVIDIVNIVSKREVLSDA